VCTEGEQIERCDDNAMWVVSVNRWSDVMILLCCTEGEQKERCDDKSLCVLRVNR
jgi:hypothetical protein